MDNQALWGILLILYIMLGGFWMFWMSENDQTLEIRKKLYPGREAEEEKKHAKKEKHAIYLGTLWCVGLAILLLAWKTGIKPLGGVALLIVFAFTPWLLKKVIQRISMASKKTRIGITASFFWFIWVGFRTINDWEMLGIYLDNWDKDMFWANLILPILIVWSLLKTYEWVGRASK